ncbi:MAG: NAD-dependent epimerase/dehydratase family protein [Boseongicola sp.]|nr:NAD-dependent epimerase/dehydratase family protein [Boseongicola sp.]MDD9979008.1 NAD-dependent epimerase/dehydratase family protein [Boseongicola sp.]
MTKTVLVTGATGYIAKHIVRILLDEGYNVVGSARSEARDAEMRAALEPAVKDKSSLDRYRTVALDLSKDEGWDAALQGVDVLMHTASPFPLEQPKNAEEVIRPAVDGALRALKAAKAAGCKDVVMTSSSVAIMDPPEDKETYSEADWTDPNKPGLSPYAQSKTLAEQAAWDFVKSEAPDMRLAIINPTFVQGRPLDENFGTSIKVVERLLRGKDPALPRLGFACCDVVDVAEAHVRAMENPDAYGQRHVIYDRFMWFADMAELIREAVPGAKAAKRVAPDFFIKFLGLFDPAIRGIIPSLGRVTKADNTRMRTVLGVEPKDTRESIRESARYLRSSGIA